MVYARAVPFDIHAHESETPAAPGELELVHRFMNLHEHVPGRADSLPPPREMLESFLRERRLLRERDRFGDADRATAVDLIDALHAAVRANAGKPAPAARVALMDRVARRAGLRPRFGDRPALVPTATGVAGALGRIVAVAFLAELDGSWRHLKECANEDCRSVFFDRSKNHSGRWCSMAECGNRAKVRAWRERRRVDDRS
jgi:predicted RNA-binding Zn ribbon-like protein